MLPQKSLPLTREVAFAEQMTEGETGRPHGAAPSSSQAPYRSLPPGGESSLISLLRLSPPNPRLPPLGFGGDPIMASPWGEAVERSETDEGATLNQLGG